MTCAQCAALPPTLAGLVGWRHFHGTAPCWSFVRQVYEAHLGIVLPDDGEMAPREQWSELIQEGLVAWTRAEELQPYDGVLSRSPRGGDHIGLLVDREHFIHLANPKAGVCLSRVADYLERGFLVGFYRYNPR